ncbi:helix-turn-helix transcriptional regulator [Winslowiella toletana]|uniref:helix-turn-helix transcriptional regulator n=1 Tax=Winslowiella toletana TaxID=92490 RepID=UPI0028BD44E5|nr:helix-turn-helix transcriptional regulator [Winslowiella toletana]WNN46687.1 helix-turn-helix transcriptional regulator [Winslowiella toletana]
MITENKREYNFYPTSLIENKIKKRITISIRDSDIFFIEGFKNIILSYFYDNATDVIFRDCFSPSMPVDLVFFSVPANSCNNCRSIIEPKAYSGTIFIPIRNDIRSRIQQCKPELALYRNSSIDDAYLLLKKITKKEYSFLYQNACGFTREKKLTKREYELVLYMRAGASQSEAAEMMKVNVKTVHTYKNSVMKKLGLKKKHDFIYWLLATGSFLYQNASLKTGENLQL